MTFLMRSLAIVGGVLLAALALGLAEAQQSPVVPVGICMAPGALSERLSRTHSRVIILLNRSNRLIEFWVAPGGGWVITTYTASRGLACVFDRGAFSSTVETAELPGVEAAE